MPTAPDDYAIFLSPLPKNRLCRTYTSPRGQSRVGRTSHNHQVLLDDGNRIIIPQGNFKVPKWGLDVEVKATEGVPRTHLHHYWKHHLIAHCDYHISLFSMGYDMPIISVCLRPFHV